MSIDFGLADKPSGYLEPLQAFALGHQLRQQQKQEVARTRASDQVRSGDFSGAQTTAIAGGDFDFANAVGGLQEGQRKKASEEADIIGSAAYSLKQLPPEQRAQAYAQMVPALQARGFSQAELQAAGADLSDNALNGHISTALSVKEAVAAHMKDNEQYTLAPGSARYDATGKLVQQQPFGPKTVSVSPGETVLEYQPGGGGPASSGAGGRSTRNNNPGNIIDSPFAKSQPGYQGSDGKFAIFADAQAGTAAQGALLGSYIDRGYNTVEKIISRWAPPSDGNNTSSYVAQAAQALGVSPDQPLDKSAIPKLQQIIAQVEGSSGASGNPSGPRVIARGGAKQREAPSGYDWSPDGHRLDAIPGGPGDPANPTNRQNNRKAEADYRKEFNALPEIKDFKDVRANFLQVKALALKSNPTAQDDIGLIFSYMKMLDPGSVVREGEFATAQNAAGIPDTIQNAYNRALKGNRLNPNQRTNMAGTAASIYRQRRDTYNAKTIDYRSYAEDNGINPDRVARRYVPDRREARDERTSGLRIVAIERPKSGR